MTKKITELPAVASIAGTELLPVVQGTTTKKATVNQIKVVPTGTGFRKVVSGIEQLAAEKVDLANTSEEVEGVLGVNNGGTNLDAADVALMASQAVVVNSAGTGYEGADTIDVVAAASIAGQVITWNGSMAEWLEPISLGDVGHRLSLTTAVPITSADVTGASTIYFTQFNHSSIALWNGTQWLRAQFTEISLALSSLTSGKNYDVFCYLNSGTPTLELSAAWTNDTTRADALTRQNGVLVKSGSPTRRYVATIRTTGTTTTEDSKLKRFVWNYYNRVRRDMVVTDSTTTWTYVNPNSVYRQARASSANKFEYVVGDASVNLMANAVAIGVSSSSVGSMSSGVGIDSTTVNSAQIHGTEIDNGKTGSDTSWYTGYPGLGYHAINWLETASHAAATITFVGNQFQRKSGMIGSIHG